MVLSLLTVDPGQVLQGLGRQVTGAPHRQAAHCIPASLVYFLNISCPHLRLILAK